MKYLVALGFFGFLGSANAGKIFSWTSEPGGCASPKTATLQSDCELLPNHKGSFKWNQIPSGCVKYSSTTYYYNELPKEDTPSCSATRKCGCTQEDVSGCTNSAATNFDPFATTDDGSCQGIVVGCMNPDKCNYDENANTAGECFESEDTMEFKESGTCNDPGYRLMTYTECLDQSWKYFSTFHPGDARSMWHDDQILNINVDHTVNGNIPPGCYGTQGYKLNFNQYTDSTTECDSWSNSDTHHCFCMKFSQCVSGCTDSAAPNYNAAANTDDGSCEKSNTQLLQTLGDCGSTSEQRKISLETLSERKSSSC